MTAKVVLFPYVGDSVGGSHVSSLLLAGDLPRERYRPLIACHEDGPLQAYLERVGLTAVDAPRVTYAEGGPLRRAWRRITAQRALTGFLRDNAVSVVHTNDMRMHMTWGPAARAAGVAHVWHQRSIARAGKHAREAAKAAALLTVSEFCAASFPAAMQAKARVVYNPFNIGPAIDRAAARATACETLRLPASSRLVAYVANLSPIKRPEVFVAVAAKLAAQGNDTLHFVMIGAAPKEQADALNRVIAQAGLAGRVHLTGTRHPIEPWLAAADILLAPAVGEAFGRTLVEAMLQGTPVLASDVGGHREIVRHGETGLLAPPDTPDAMARAAETLLFDKATADSMAKAARRDAENRFSTPTHTRAVTSVYDSLIRPR